MTIADMVGDIDPIKAAQAGLNLADELTMHYGLLPRANRGIFAINELPDLAGKIQVGLFNILQEGDVQIKGYPIRLKLDVMLVFTANPEDYTARGKIITPLKDRIGSEIRTHYPATRHNAMAITTQEAWTDRAPAALDGRDSRLRPRGRRGGRVPGARRSQDRQALRRQPAAADHHARARRLERRAAGARQRRERVVVPRVTDLYAALPSITGKFELEYEGELRGAEQVARDLIRVGRRRRLHRHVRRRRHPHGRRVVRPGRLAAARATPRRPTRSIARHAGVQGLRELAEHAGAAAGRAGAGGRLGDRLRARRPVRAEEDQPQRRARLRRRHRARRPPAPRAARNRRSTKRSACRAGRRSITTEVS